MNTTHEVHEQKVLVAEEHEPLETSYPFATESADPVETPIRELTVDLKHPLVTALLTMNRVQRRAFGTTLKKMNRSGRPGLDQAWIAARVRGWRGVIPNLRQELKPKEAQAEVAKALTIANLGATLPSLTE